MQKRLYRSTRDKVIGGVAGGLGTYFDIDPLIIRILFVVGALTGGWGILAYIICWIVVPQEPVQSSGSAATPAPQDAVPPPPPARGRGGVILGTALIAIGALFLADNFIPGFCLHDYWPVLLILLGAALLLRKSG